MSVENENIGPWVTDEYWTSPFNFEKAVIRRPEMPARIKIHDTTLRDGAQTPGVVFRKDDKVAIAKMLDEIGIDRIEAGMPAVSMQEQEAIRAVVDLNLNAEVYCACPAGRKESEIDFAAAIGIDGISTRIPVGYPRVKYNFPDWTEEDIINIGIRTISYAKDKGLRVVVGLFDASRAEKSFLERVLVRICESAAPDEFTLIDTTGSILPNAAAFLVRFIKELTGLPIAMHTHNDLGLGLASSLAGMEAGAEVIHVCVNGLGERSGNVSLDELVMTLQCCYGRQTRVNYHRLTELSEMVARLSNIPVNRNKPLMGESIYCRESGLALRLIREEPRALFPVLPQTVGRISRVVLGKGSGLDSIEFKIDELGIEGLTDREKKKAILGRVKELAYEKKRLVNDDEFREIVANVIGNP